MGTLTSMVDFAALGQATQFQSINVKGTLSHISELKTGTGQYGEWSMKRIKLKDSSGELEIAVFNKDIEKFTSGDYEIINLQWKEKNGFWNASIGKNTIVMGEGATETSTSEQPPERTSTKEIPDTEPSSLATDKIPTEQKIIHDQVWAFALTESTKVYKLGTAGQDLHLKDRMILAQVFYKKNMDYMIHRGKN